MVMNILRSRKFAKRVMFALLILIIPAFVLWGVGSMGKRPKPVGRIGRQDIYPRDIAKSMQGVKIQLLLAYQGDLDTLNKIMRNYPLVNRMALERLVFLSAARKTRVKISDSEIRSYVSAQPIFQRSGIFDDEIYAYVLRNTLSMPPRTFEELIRQNLEVIKFRQGLLKDVDVTDEEVMRFYKMVNDKAGISYFLLDKELFADKANMLPGESRKYYEANRERFLSPARIELEYIEIPYENAKKKADATDLLKDIYPELRRSPEQFNRIAEKHGFRHGKTGPFYREELIPGIKFSKEMHELAFRMKKGEVSHPLIPVSEKGEIYILYKTEDHPPEPLAFENVEEKINTSLKERKKLELARKKAEELHKTIASGDTSLEEAAEELKLKVISTEPLTSNSYLENIGPARGIVLLALETEPGKITSPIPTRKGTLLVRTDNIIPADETKLNEQKEDLRQVLLNQKQIAVLDEWFKRQAGK